MLVLLLCVSASLLVEACSGSMIDLTTFSFASFRPESCSSGELLCMGSATSGEGHLRLTPEPWINSSSPWSSAMNKIGRVLYPQRVRAWPALISTSFTTRINPMDNNSTISGDGLTFVFASNHNPSPPASYGSYLGLFDHSTQGESLQQIAVEFDTFKNEFDRDGNHVGVVTGSTISPVATESLNPLGIKLSSGQTILVKIEYDGSINNLYVSLGYSERTLKSVLNLTLDLPNIVPNTVYVGFTASTGNTLPESHEILNWVFTSVPLPSLCADNKPSQNETIKTILIIVIPIFLAILASSFPFIWETMKKRKKKINKRGDNNRQQVIDQCSSVAAPDIPKEFTFKQLSMATSTFRKENLLGRGGFGSVYKGLLFNPAKTIAVKKISANSKQGEREYFAEICTIGRLRHKNIVQLLGWCHEDEYLLLVYEYMQNGSLDRFIGKDILNWQTRHKILVGLASALVYLHEDCGNPVVHRDVKPNNVMLDSDYNAHLGDFGLARLLYNEESVITNLAGTPGYLAPEIGFTGKATPESDVYSFGMVVLEVICGRRSTKGNTEDNYSLADYVWNMHSENALMECVDALLGDEFDEEEVRRALMVGLTCLSPDPVFRPKMRKVVHILLDPNEPLMELPMVRPLGVYVSVSSSTSRTSNFGSTRGHSQQLLHSGTTSLEEISIVYDQQ